MKIVGRLLLVVALLFAQAGSVTHEIWHAASLAAAIESDADSKAPNKNLLCDFHTALASVLGAIHGDAPAIDAVAVPQTVFIAADVPAAGLSALAPRSRAPPALL